MKPKALVVANPFEGRIGYFLAGLSHYFELEVLYLTDHQFTKESQVFYRWLYDSDVSFTLCKNPNEVFEKKGTYEYFFFHADPFNVFSNSLKQSLEFFKDKDDLLTYLLRVKQKIPHLYYIEMGEIFFFSFTSQKFWDMVDGVIKHHVFKKEFAYLVREEAKNPNAFKYSSTYLAKNRHLMLENSLFEAEKYYHKIFPLPFPPSIVDQPSGTVPLKNRLYDVGGNFHIAHKLRCGVAQVIKENLKPGQTYGIDYGAFWESNKKSIKNIFNSLLVEKMKLTRLLSKIKYGKYKYPKLLYVHALKRSRCFLGLGLFYSSYRTADVWSYGSVLISWSHDKVDYGVPLVNGYNYISIGEREEISPNNIDLRPEYKEKIVDAVQKILNDPQKQQEIVENGQKTYQEFFSSPKQLVQKIFIQRANLKL